MEPLSQYAKWLLTLMVWREASNTPRAWRMVIWTVLNRASARNVLGKPMWWGGDVVSVITKKWQFTSMTGNGDPNLTRWPTANDPVYEAIANEVDVLTDGTVPVQTDAVYYFSLPLTSPPAAWGPVSLALGGDCGAVKFYRQGGPPLSLSDPTPSDTTPDPSRIQ